MQIIFKKELYNSRSELVRKLLKLKKYNKSTIAQYADVTPQTVEYLYKKLIKQNEIDNYYPNYIKNRKLKRLTRRNTYEKN